MGLSIPGFVLGLGMGNQSMESSHYGVRCQNNCGSLPSVGLAGVSGLRVKGDQLYSSPASPKFDLWLKDSGFWSSKTSTLDGPKF